MENLLNVDDSQKNADFTKFRQIDIPGCRDIYELFDRFGVEYSGDNGAQNIVNFVESHQWLDNIDAETSWIIDEARKRVEQDKKP